MPPRFGTSGLRGLVTELTPDLVASHVAAFLAACDPGPRVLVGRDLRESSPALAEVVLGAVVASGREAVDCGTLCTPALALAAKGAGAIMVTGSHIPADRNGLKFYVPLGEIGKPDEAAILAALGRAAPAVAPGRRKVETGATAAYIERLTRAYGPRALAGRRLGLWVHSAVGAPALAAILRACGAEVIEIEPSETFVPIDTEALDDPLRARIAAWVREHRLDALVSADGDSDRPLLADERGRVVPGDLLGQIAARALGAETVVTPVSSNGSLEGAGFARVVRTRIGSPFVIAAMAAEGGRVAGYEANGGFLLGFEAQGPAGAIDPLMTRDAALPLVAVLAAASDGVARLVAAHERRFTAADRLEHIPPERSAALVARLAQDAARRHEFLDRLGLSGSDEAPDLTDGLRLTRGGRVVHVRPSGNAPELRLYIEAESPEAAAALLARGLAALRDELA